MGTGAESWAFFAVYPTKDLALSLLAYALCLVSFICQFPRLLLPRLTLRRILSPGLSLYFSLSRGIACGSSICIEAFNHLQPGWSLHLNGGFSSTNCFVSNYCFRAIEPEDMEMEEGFVGFLERETWNDFTANKPSTQINNRMYSRLRLKVMWIIIGIRFDFS